MVDVQGEVTIVKVILLMVWFFVTLGGKRN